jgi:hypothetical protein
LTVEFFLFYMRVYTLVRASSPVPHDFVPASKLTSNIAAALGASDAASGATPCTLPALCQRVAILMSTDATAIVTMKDAEDKLKAVTAAISATSATSRS